MKKGDGSEEVNYSGISDELRGISKISAVDAKHAGFLPICGLAETKTFSLKKIEELGFQFDKYFVYFSDDTFNTEKLIVREWLLTNQESWQNSDHLVRNRKLAWIEKKEGEVYLAVHTSWVSSFGPDSSLVVRNVEGKEVEIINFVGLILLDDAQYKFVESVYSNYLRYYEAVKKKLDSE